MVEVLTCQRSAHDREALLLLLLEVEVQVVEQPLVAHEGQLQVVELEEVPHQLAQILSLSLSLSLSFSLSLSQSLYSRLFFLLHACTDLLLAFSAQWTVYTSSQSPVVAVPAPQRLVAGHLVRKLVPANPL